VQCNGHLLLTDTTLRITEHERGWMKVRHLHARMLLLLSPYLQIYFGLLLQCCKYIIKLTLISIEHTLSSFSLRRWPHSLACLSLQCFPSKVTQQCERNDWRLHCWVMHGLRGAFQQLSHV